MVENVGVVILTNYLLVAELTGSQRLFGSVDDVVSESFLVFGAQAKELGFPVKLVDDEGVRDCHVTTCSSGTELLFDVL